MILVVVDVVIINVIVFVVFVIVDIIITEVVTVKLLNKENYNCCYYYLLLLYLDDINICMTGSFFEITYCCYYRK